LFLITCELHNHKKLVFSVFASIYLLHQARDKRLACKVSGKKGEDGNIRTGTPGEKKKAGH
jgi:hypothetical protein